MGGSASDMDGYDDCQPVKIDSNIRFSSIGGLKEHIKCLREMVLFPMIYPELFKKFNTNPAKGVLFYGPPGTGKTLLARALANECSLVGGTKVTFFMRKGADCLGKWVGESERAIRRLFEVADSMKPAIIFFDEIDALAPDRSKNHNGEWRNSVVATLLAEMDGLHDRGDLIIIGATNRPDALDPAVRRAGRFDRELYFPPPELNDRLEILKIYTASWEPEPGEQVLHQIAKTTNGYLGSDIKALCSEAVLKAIRRVYPQIYESEYKLLVDAKNVEVTVDDMAAAMSMITPSTARVSPLVVKPLPKHCLPLLEAQVQAAFDMLREVFPPVSVVKKATVTTPSVFLVTGPCAGNLITPAMLAKLEPCLVKELDVAAMIGRRSESRLIEIVSECRRSGGPCVLFIRDVISFWKSLSESKDGAAVLMQMWRTRAMGELTLLLGASSVDISQFPQELHEIFPSYKKCVYTVREPTVAEVTNFFAPLVTEYPLVPPIDQTYRPPPPLPRAPPPPPHMTQEAIERRRAQEEARLRHLRVILREICLNLRYDRRFYKFAESIDLKEMKDYAEIIKRPMDLTTMMSKVDMQQYYSAQEFLDDVDLIACNAFVYNPDKETSDKKVRMHACILRDIAHEAVSEEIETKFEIECQIIARRRRSSDEDDGAGGVPPVHGVYFADLNFHLGSPPDLLKDTDHLSRKRHGNSSNVDGVQRKRHKSDRDDRGERKSRSIKINDVSDAPPVPSAGAEDDEGGVGDSKGTDEGNNKETVPMKVLINLREMDDLISKNAETLRTISLEALVELYGDFSKTVSSYLFTHDRMRLPMELQSIMNRYLTLANR